MVRREAQTLNLWIAGPMLYTTWANLTNFRMLLIAYMNVACHFVMIWFNYDVIYVARDINI